MRPAWQITEEGLEVWVQNNKVATIPTKDLPHLLADLAVSLRYRHKESRSDGTI
jgi:hypothetical protein